MRRLPDCFGIYRGSLYIGRIAAKIVEGVKGPEMVPGSMRAYKYRIAGLVITGFIAIFFILASADDYQSATLQGEAMAAENVRVAAGRVNASVRAVADYLQDVAIVIRYNSNTAPEAFEKLETDRFQELPEVHSRRLRHMDRDGHAIIKDGVVTDYSDRSYYLFQKQHFSDNKLFISEPLIGKVFKDSLNIAFSRAKVTRDGQFDGILVIGVKQDFFNNMLSGTELYPGRGLLYKGAGEYLAGRFGEPGGFSGDELAAYARTGEAEQIHPTTRIEGTGSLLNISNVWAKAYFKVGTYDLYCAVSVPGERFLTNWKSHHTRDLALIIIVIILILIFAWVADTKEGRLYRALNELKTTGGALETEIRAKNELLTAQQAFVAMISHEFRSPLSLIDGHAQQIVTEAAGGIIQKLGQRSAKIRAAVQRIIGLVNSILLAQSLEQTSLSFKPVEMSLSSLLRQVCEAGRWQHDGSGGSIHLTLERDRLDIWGDPMLLEHVFSNLVSNAIKYSSQNMPIEVRGLVQSGYAVITVTDKGIGIPAQDVERVFDRYFRAGNTKTIPGTGIGLFLVREIVVMHKGTIAVTSEEKEGSQFTVRLPLAPSIQKDG